VFRDLSSLIQICHALYALIIVIARILFLFIIHYISHFHFHGIVSLLEDILWAKCNSVLVTASTSCGYNNIALIHQYTISRRNVQHTIETNDV